jgi:3-hydroxyacyl-CoA dehydrogenase/enoyl-CoA hydratase/3-hydroxybutyryl-CoA epimerase/enoyl-CoA isomerase
MAGSVNMYRGKSIRVELLADGIAELCFDREGDAINKFDRRTVQELVAATAVIRGAADLRGVLVTSSKGVFIAGADIFEFAGLFVRSETEVAAFIGEQNRAFSGFEDLPVPIVTAVNGYALGGGLEQALASDYRVMASTAQIGLPEVTLGIFPGYGGTVRLPRLAGAAVAIEWITSGKPRGADAALAAGVVDALAPPEQLRALALERLGRAIAAGEWRARRTQRRGPFALDAGALDAARKQLAKSAALYPAPLAALELMTRCAPLGRDAALAIEHLEFARIGRTQAAASMVQQFVNDQFIKNKVKAQAKIARPLRRAGVLGAGIMGGGIACTSAMRGVPVVMKDIAQAALDLGTGEARKQVGKQVEAGRMKPEKAAAVLAAITATLDFDGFADVDVVVEAVVEKLAVKQQVLAEVERRVRADTIIASNTSSLPIGTIAAALQRPENFLGMHFFNPVPVMPLVEVIRGAQTGDVAAATVVGYAATLGKTPIVVADCPGFLVNRILTAYLLGHLRALHDGADYLAVDAVMEKFGWPMGPAYLQDVIGMDTMKHVVEIIAAGYPDRCLLEFPLATMLLADAKRLGQKNGVGFYRYETDPRGKPKKLVDPQTAQLLATLQPRGRREFSEAEIIERLMLPMMVESALCLEQGVAASAAEIDTALALGLGFPRYAGGPLKYCDWLGLAHVVRRCDAHADLGPLYRASARMRAMAAAAERYFPGEVG